MHYRTLRHAPERECEQAGFIGIRLMRSISHTASEVTARRIVDRLCRRHQYGQAWRDYAVREISTALTVEAARRRREEFERRSTGEANATPAD
jgi:hypothetical protein